MDGRTTLVLNWRRAGIALVVAAVALGATPALAAAARPEITRRPALTGTAQVGQRLEARDARWTAERRHGDLRVGALHLRDVMGRLRGDRRRDRDGVHADGRGPGEARPRVADGAQPRRAGRRRLGRDGGRGRGARADAHPDAHADADPTPTPTPAPAPPVVTAPPPPAPAAPDSSPEPAGNVRGKQVRMMRPFPLVRIRGWLTSRGAMIEALTVRGPRGLSISVRCHGDGCPRRQPRADGEGRAAEGVRGLRARRRPARDPRHAAGLRRQAHADPDPRREGPDPPRPLPVSRLGEA